MRIDGNKYYIENKKNYKECSIFKKETIDRVFEFAYAMSFGKGEHRDHRSGGQYSRRNGEIFINAFQGKLAELGIYNYVFTYNKKMYEKLSAPDFEVYGLGEWDDTDISFNNLKFSIKSTKHFGNLLLLEKKDWNKEAEYIPNIESGNSHYDYTILVRVYPDGEKLMKANQLLYQDNIKKELLKEIICSENWTYDIPGYITHNDLKEIIAKQQIIPQNALLNGKIKMDAENYYEESGNLRDFAELVKSFI